MLSIVLSCQFSVLGNQNVRLSGTVFPNREARIESFFDYHATPIAVAIKFAIATGSRNFQPNAISWS